MWLMDRMIHPIIVSMRLVLASASPRRAELLHAAGFEFEPLVVEVDERVRPGEKPEDYVRRLADTAVVIDGTLLGKPRDDQESASMLRRLSGRPHEVMTGVSLRHAEWETTRVEKTTVEFSRLSDADIAWYVESGEGRDKAGGYGIQGLASRFIPRIQGSYSNVVGLPMTIVHELVAEIASHP